MDNFYMADENSEAPTVVVNNWDEAVTLRNDTENLWEILQGLGIVQSVLWLLPGSGWFGTWFYYLLAMINVGEFATVS